MFLLAQSWQGLVFVTFASFFSLYPSLYWHVSAGIKCRSITTRSMLMSRNKVIESTELLGKPYIILDQPTLPAIYQDCPIQNRFFKKENERKNKFKDKHILKSSLHKINFIFQLVSYIYNHLVFIYNHFQT